MRNREVNREQWLKMQAKCGTYLNKLNSLYKRNGSSPGSEGSGQAFKDLTADPSQLASIAFIGYNDGTKEAAERRQKNAVANNQLIIEQARNRSEERGNERMEAQKAAQA